VSVSPRAVRALFPSGPEKWSRLGSNQRPSTCEVAEIAIDLRFMCFCASYVAH
jgi:hypothetical protein